MQQWQPTDTYSKIASANRLFYAQTATQYDSTETCVTDARAQALLEADLDRILQLLQRPAAQVRALDACGGSGNISLKLLRRGVQVTLADISEELQAIFRRKCAAEGFTAKIHTGEIADFLSHSGDSFDLIVFSSALHHLENVEAVLCLARERMAPGGLLFTVFDPTSRAQHHLLTRALQRVDYYGFKVFCQTSDVFAAFGRRTKRLLSGTRAANKSAAAVNESTAGLLAEYHVEKGIDDLALVSRLKQAGYEVVWHERYPGGRTALTRWLVRMLGDATSFKLLLRRMEIGRPAK
jgi:2-polyprenyl-3-methyl-5-hydroxy-6-metoxy-1,4-benzoquinol methylase